MKNFEDVNIREFINDVLPASPKGELGRAVVESIERDAMYEAFVMNVLISEAAKGLSC